MKRIEPLIKYLLPKTLFGRSLLIIVTPLILMQAISTFVFFDRHWDTMTRRLSHTLAGDMAFIIDAITPIEDGKRLRYVTSQAKKILHINLSYNPNEILLNSEQQTGDRVQQTLSKAMMERIKRPFLIDPHKLNRRVLIYIQLAKGVLTVDVHQKRLYSSTPYIFLMWMIGSSLVLFAIAIVFMRNQIRHIRRLAFAARSFGMGRDPGDLKPGGATEVRQAAFAFGQMRQRILRQFSQRTEMLAGVSHDLRTPLTRMKLQLAMLERSPEIKELEDDVHDMQKMIEGYLAFARGEGTETPIVTNLQKLIGEVVAAEKRDGSKINLTMNMPNPQQIEVRPQALKRAITNLISNSKRYGKKLEVQLLSNKDAVTLIVDDDGPGIPTEFHEDVFKAFFRLEPSRNPQTGGTGLGLTIARDIARSHGGELELRKAPIGGLRAVINIPV